MTTAANQYRALVSKLESIQLNELKIGDINPQTGKRVTGGMTDSEGNLVGSGTPGVYWNYKEEPVATPAPQPDVTPAPQPDVKPEPAQEPVVTPVTPPTDVTPTPVPDIKCGPEAKEQIKAQKTFNAAYAMAKKAGCDEFDWCQIVNVGGQSGKPADPWYNAPGMGKGSVVTKSGEPEFAAVNEDEQLVAGDEELDQYREIAGTNIVQEAGEIPEIKASTKDQAIAIAQKKGIKTFRFCGKYKVQAAKGGQSPKPAEVVPSAAAVGNPNISRSTTIGNPNIRPGSLRDRAAQANAARRPDAPRM